MTVGNERRDLMAEVTPGKARTGTGEQGANRR
jgi:hypothetical protein